MKKSLRILQDLALVPEGRNCALIIRHADRNGAIDALVDAKEGLNEVGRKRSMELGAALRRFDYLRMISSPVERCVETCEAMAKGFGPNHTIETTEYLGMMAPTMLQPGVAYQLMRSMGLHGFVEAYVAGRIDKKAVLSCEEGARMLMAYAIDRLRGATGTALSLVTHDMLITPAMVRYFGYDHRTKGLVPFLDGMVLYESDYGLRLCHAGKVLKVTKDGNIKD
ncbi:MAG: histidine phosphatase family protein [Methanomassiliicoccales archaeon]|jgi:hypothetical protein|nr:histidine phosphatase family protein [Methanomassiliicoccales archaeon]